MRTIRDPIQVIESFEERAIDPENRPGDRWDGWRLATRLREVFVLVSSGQSCCENFGYLSTPDDPQQFLGAELLGIEVIEDGGEGWRARAVEECGSSVDEGLEAAFVRFKTSMGDFELSVYNSHNGYYGHAVEVIQRNIIG